MLADLLAARARVLQLQVARREQIREHLSGTYCRCTGYQAIVDAIEEVLHGKS
jgi:carbon-monoxide dehydrogenase small subunit